MLSEKERIELQNKVRDFYNSKKGERILKKINKKDLKDFKKKRGWFSPEENEYWKKLEEKIRNFFQTKEGKEFLKENKERTIREARTNIGWFSKEEDEVWKHLK